MRRPLAALLMSSMIASTPLFAGDPPVGGPITFVIPFGPGGGYDTTARIYAPELADVLGTSVSPSNIAGASGIRGAQTVYRAPPDGTTIGIFNMPGLLVSETSGVELGFDLDEISWIATLGAEPQGVAVAAGSGFQSLADLCASGRPIRLSHSGALSTGAVISTILFAKLGCETTMVHGYQSAAESAVAVMRGDVEATVKPLGSLASLVASGDLRMIFTLTDKPVLKGVQTAVDIGHPELARLTTWRVIGGPPGMDPALVKAFTEAFREVASTPDVKAWSDATGLSGEILDSTETAAMLRDVAGLLEEYRGILAP